MARDSWLEKELAELEEAEQLIQQTMSKFDSPTGTSQAAEQNPKQADDVTTAKVTNHTDVDKLTSQLIQELNAGKRKESYDGFHLPPPPDLDQFIISQKENKAPTTPDAPPPPPLANEYPSVKQANEKPKTAPPPTLPKPSRSTPLKAPSRDVQKIKIAKDSSNAPTSEEPLPPPPGYKLTEQPEEPIGVNILSPLPPVAAGIPDNIKKNSSEELDFLTNNLLSNMENPHDDDLYGYCEKCNMVVEGEKVGCNALDTIFHIKCFTCATCGMELHGEPFFAVEKTPYCQTCYVASLEKCTVCSETINDRILRATGKPFHPECFKCSECGKSLDGVPFTVDDSNKIYCVEDYHNKYAPRCCVCDLPIIPEAGKEETVRIIALDRSYHVKCYKCEKCGIQFSSDQGCYPLDDHIYCQECNTHMVQQLTA